ncbi:MAG: hypothetical protein A2Z21_00770 [Candidatus Fraserbacteria bacterium RBG_16_55_9]|uniref:Peptidase M20 dimerisation domain-containing protein n=1 Tax=Fraserbacteria sp. (strain RBG_16_55_9) TaxID=1817864 RepID=A0A1F5UXP0_FRAXR|nr:MAG: hypothetical protein A2Z21_00770 [Candidatus Fraserbacteria bacterium RBG_16_55_9]
MARNHIRKHIDDHAEQAVLRLQKLCRQPSVSAQGVGLRECAELVRGLMVELGLHAELVSLKEGPPVVYGELRSQSSKRTLVFYNHYDVQPPDPLELWESDPWAAEIREGRVYARGAADNKANIVSRLAAIEAFLKTRGDLPCNIKFVVEGEEETGSPHFAEYIHQERSRLKGEGAIWEFGGLDYGDIPAVTLGLKGMLYVEFCVKTLAKDSHSARAAIVENPAWRLLRALGTLRDERGRVAIEGWYDDVRGFTPEELKALEKEPLQEEQLKSDLGISQFLAGMSGLELKKALAGNPTANIAGFYSGYIGEGHKTVLPAYAKAKMDFRLVPDQDPEALASLLRNHLKQRGFGDIQLAIQSENPAARTPLNSEIARIACDTAHEVFGAEPIVHVSSAGSGPMHLFTHTLKLPTVAIGCNHPYSNTHAPNENQRIDALISGTKWIAAVMERFGGKA